MAHSYTNLLFHIIFSTKNRKPWIDEPLRPRLLAYLGGIVRELGGKALIVGGTADHVHLLARLTATMAVADLLRVLKANSSRWVHEEWVRRDHFGWQTGYAAFSVSQSAADKVKGYIANQEQHHRKMTFQEEFLALLERHGIRYDRRFVGE